MTTEAYPLYWPEGRPRTLHYNRERARFDMSLARARDEVVRQIEMMCGRYEWQHREANLIISTNLQLRRDGLPLANQRAVDDPGVAVYFDHKKRRVCFACDRWDKIEDNMQAIAKTIEALRGIDRWGTGDMMEAAFRGFTALPDSASTNWRIVLGVPTAGASAADIRAMYMQLRSKHHPDHGGDPEQFRRVQAAFEAAQREGAVA